MIGAMSISRPAGFEQGQGAVARVYLFGPRGGTIGSTYIGKEDAEAAISRLATFASSKQRPIVLTHIDGDSYGGDSVAFAGVGVPITITFDAGRYDKYNRSDDDDPAADYAENLASIAFNPEAHAQLQAWVDEVTA